MQKVKSFSEFINEDAQNEAFQGWSADRAYGMFNDHNGKPSKLSKEILEFCMKGLPKKITDKINDVTSAGWKDSMVSPPSVSNKGQSRGEIEYTTIMLNFVEAIGKNKITNMTVGLRKRTSGPGTGYIAAQVHAGQRHVPAGEHAIEFMDDPSKALEKLYDEKLRAFLI
jgi:hypothetical protein